MANRVLTITLVVIMGVLIGVGVILNQGKDPVLADILRKQDQIIASQKVMNESVVSPAIKELERRLVKLESEVRQMKEGPQVAAQRQGPPPEDLNKVYEIPVGDSYVNGPKDAPITIVEFVDLQCPYCSRFHQAVLDVMEAYPDQVNHMVKNFPLSFHPNARPAAKAALAAGEQGKYFEMIDRLLVNGINLTQENYLKLAADLGLDVEKFKKDLIDNEDKYNQLIEDDIKLGSEIDVRGTPTFFLNGRKTMARDLSRFKVEIEAILNKE